MISGLSFYKILFMAELLVGEFLFCSRLKRREHFLLRTAIAILVDFAFSAAVPVLYYNAIYSSGLFLLLFLITFFSMAICYREPWGNLLFCCIAGYSIQHIAYEFYNLCVILLGAGNVTLNSYGSDVGWEFNPLVMCVYIAVYFPVYLVAYLAFSRRIRVGELQIRNVTLLALVVLIIVFDVVMNVCVVYWVEGMNDQSEANFLRIMAGIYNIFCCALAILIQFELSLRRHLEERVDTLQHLRRMEKRQYESLKENIDLINMKCHDIKHQLALIGQRGMMSSEYIHEMEDVISIYDSTVKTGNDTLDIILTEKSLRCNRNGIRFSCIADASGLERMRESDLYSLFGNLIDNAIESVIRLDEEQRVIGFQIKKQENEAIINIYNNFDGNLVFKDGLPVTTKGDMRYHGFGLKSVQSICEKYDGELSIYPHDNIFDLTIRFPI